MNASPACIIDHLENIWPDREKELFTWKLGPIENALPGFRVCCVKPIEPTEPWIYVSIGASQVKIASNYRLEFMLEAPADNARHIETLAIVAHYHATGDTLDLGHIVNGGRPWLNESKCDRFLVSLPYPFGPRFEWLHSDANEDTRFLWLLPITSNEASYAKTQGIESLEQLFDKYEIDAVDPARPSVV